MTPDGLETVTYTTPRGSHVTLPFLTVEQRDAAVENLSPAAPPPGPVTAGKKDTCSNCGGAGGYNEQREQQTAGGGTVVVTVWVPCRPCKGSGTR